MVVGLPAFTYASATGVNVLPDVGIGVGVLVKADVGVGVEVGNAPLNSNETLAIVVA